MALVRLRPSRLEADVASVEPQGVPPRHPVGEPAPAPRTSRYGPGELPGVINGRIPTDPVTLTAALQALHPDEPARRVAAIGELATRHDTPLPARRAILRVLADVPGLVLHGRAVLEGRPRLAVSVSTGTDRHVLIIDPASGEIRAAEDVLLDPVIGRNLAVRTPYSLSRVVITDRGRTNRPHH